MMLGSGNITESHHLCLQRICYLVRERERKVNFCNNSFSSFNKNIENKYYYYSYIIDEENVSQRLSNLSSVTKVARGGLGM